MENHSVDSVASHRISLKSNTADSTETLSATTEVTHPYNQTNPVVPHHISSRSNPESSGTHFTRSSSHHTSKGPNITNIQFLNVGQVIHVSGEGNTVYVPGSKILMQQQAIGVNPTVGAAYNMTPPQGEQPSTSHNFATHPKPYGPMSTDMPAIQECVSYAKGPPEGIELVELTQKLMVLKNDWVRLAHCLETPEHEIASIEVEEGTLYRKINRTLRYWIDADEGNERQTLVSKLPEDLASKVRNVLKKN